MIEIKVPELSESISEATLLDWKKKVGDFVAEGDVLIEIETDKITIEVYTPVNGVLESTHASEGENVKTGVLLAKISEQSIEAKSKSEKSPTDIPEDSPKEQSSSKVMMPSAKKIAQEQAVSPSEISGSGKGGRITKGDVLNEIKNREVSPPSDNSVLLSPQSSTKRVAMSKIRARIADRLLASQRETATLSTFNEVNMQPIIDIRARYREAFEKKYKIKLGFMSFFVKAAVYALKNFPVINASVDQKDIIYHEYYDIGIAVSSARGLVVPIVRSADQLSLAEIENNIADFGKRAQTGSLGLDEISGGTFSITNGGVFGSLLSTPIINPPQSAILGVHATKERPVAENNVVVIRPMCYLALSYDHRIIDGKEAVLFLSTIKNLLEDPVRLLLEV